MGDLNQVLSQDDIDNLVAKNPPKKNVPHATITLEETSPQIKKSVSIPVVDNGPRVVQQNPPPSPKIAKSVQTASGHHEECIAAGEIQSLAQQISDLSARLAKIEASIGKIESRSQSFGEVSMPQIKSAVQQMKNVSSQVEIITEGLRGTAGYNLNKTFKCSSCKSTGVVAIKVKCTQCGQENWWGWWPKKK
jgi:hypothetical protein